MGDATHDNVPELAKVPGLQLVAGYDTGSPSIDWTSADWARFPGVPHVTIDQGFTGSPNLAANVRDVEPGAWAPGQAVDRSGWNVPRPTIYCNQSTLPSVLADGWKGDLWLAIPGHTGPPPAVRDCVVVAIQDDYNNPAYDLSTVYDPYWPLETKAMNNVIQIPNVPGSWIAVYHYVPNAIVVGQGTDGRVWVTKFVNGVWTAAQPV
jgi:hypothetical protein